MACGVESNHRPSAAVSVVYLDPSWAQKSPEAAIEDALSWLENRGNDKREYKNAIAFVVPNRAQMDKARKGARMALAIASLLDQKKKYKFTTEDADELTSKGRDTANEVSAAIRRLYDYILLPLPDPNGSKPVRLETIDLQSQLNTSQNLQDRVLDALKNHVFESITPGKLVRLSGLENPDTEYITAEELVSYFFRFPNFPKMLGVEPIKRAILKAVEQGILGYVPSMTVSSDGTPLVENPSLLSLNRVIPPDELDISGYLLSPSLATQLRTPTLADEELDTTTSQDDSDGDTNQQKTQPDYLGSVSSTEQKTVGEGKKAVEYKSEASSVKRSVLVDIVNGKQPARHYKLTSTTNKSQIFQLFEVLQALSDKADDMTISIEVRAHTHHEFDTTWIRNAIEEPLDEMDIQASTQLE